MAASKASQHPTGCTIFLLPSRPWLYQLGAAGLADVSDAAIEAVCRGVDVLWLQGIWEVGPAGRAHDLADPGRRKHFCECLPDFADEDCIGSPYAVTRYAVNPQLGGEGDLARFRQRLAARHVRLMLDFVPNHTARDSPWVDDDGIHIPGAAGPVYGRDPYSGEFGAWTDTAQLNYWSQACRDRMVESLLYVAAQCDGVRVDMAMLCCSPVIDRTWGSELRRLGFQAPEVEFWPWALPQVHKQFPDFFLLAECYEYDQIFPQGTGRQLLQEGFDAVYDKLLYDRLAEGHMDQLRGHIFGDALLPQGRLCHFVENHDEPRAAAEFGARAAAAAAIALTLPGPRLVNWGQERGLRCRLGVQLRRSRPEPRDAAVEVLYERLLAALPHCRGEWLPLQPFGDGAWRLVAWGWRQALDDRPLPSSSSSSSSSPAMLVANFTDGEAWARMRPSGLLGGRGPGDGSGSVKLTDALTGEVYEREVKEMEGDGLVVGLKPFQAHLFLLE